MKSTDIRRWTEHEDELLRAAIGKSECSRRWHQSLNPNIKYGRWSSMEDQTLRQAVQIHGRKWTEIVDRYFPNRTPIAAKKRYTERFQIQGNIRSSSEEIPHPPEDETLDVMQSLTPAEKIGSTDRRLSSTELSRLSGPYQEGNSHSIPTEDGLGTCGPSLYDSNFSFETTSTIESPRNLNANEMTSKRSLSHFSQTDPLSTAVYQKGSPTTTIHGADLTSLHPSRASSSSFIYENASNINNSVPLGLYPCPQPHPFNMLTGGLPTTTFDQITPSIDYGDALAYPASFSAFPEEEINRERTTESFPLSLSPKRQRGPLGIPITRPFPSLQQEQYTPSMTTPEIHPRLIKRRFI